MPDRSLNPCVFQGVFHAFALEGRTAGFYCYGDGGADEMDAADRPKLLRHKGYFGPDQEPFENDRDAYAPLVWQCRFSGIEVPDHLWRYKVFGTGKPYSDNQSEHMAAQPDVFRDFDAWVAGFADFVSEKGKVEPGEFRAYGYEPPGHKIADLKLKWRALRMAVGLPPVGSSPAAQQGQGLNRDATLFPSRSTGEQQ